MTKVAHSSIAGCGDCIRSAGLVRKSFEDSTQLTYRQWVQLLCLRLCCWLQAFSGMRLVVLSDAP